MRAPDFWNRSDWQAQAMTAALTPFGWLYSATVRLKAARAQPFHAGGKVICVGNLTAGGVGKTPVAIAIARALSARGKQPVFLTRGFGGKLKGPILVEPAHRAADVGDEPLLLAAAFPTVVARDRAEGAKLALAHGADYIVMDDGHQNFTLHKDLSLVVVDAAQGFGNNRVLPAGPLRETVRQGLSRADAAILVGEGAPALPGFDRPVLNARIHAADIPELRSARVVAFAGIGQPDKFFCSLTLAGADIAAARGFPDHHMYTASEIARLKSLARAQAAQLITTEKDYVRLNPPEREGIAVLPVEARFDDPAPLYALLDRLDRFP